MEGVHVVEAGPGSLEDGSTPVSPGAKLRDEFWGTKSPEAEAKFEKVYNI